MGRGLCLLGASAGFAPVEVHRTHTLICDNRERPIQERMTPFNLKLELLPFAQAPITTLESKQKTRRER